MLRRAPNRFEPWLDQLPNSDLRNGARRWLGHSVLGWLVWGVAITAFFTATASAESRPEQAATDTPATNRIDSTPKGQPRVATDTTIAADPATSSPSVVDVGTAGAAAPGTPATNDPMLGLVAPAARTLASWSEAVTLLKARSLDLRVALLDVTKAEAQSRTALASVLPSLNGGANYTHQLIQRTTQSPGIDAAGNPTTRETTSPTADTLSGNISLVQPLINAAAWYAIGTAKVSEEIARLSVEDLKRRLTLGTANSVVAVVAAERVAELNRNGLSIALARQELTRAKLRNGAATNLDLKRAEQDVIAARSSLLTGDESLRQAREALGLALGYAEPVGVRPDLRLDSLANDTQSSCRKLHDLRERADIASLSKQRELSERQASGVERQFLPTLNLQSAVSATTPKAVTSPPVLWNIQAVLNWSIWDGGARYGALRLARASAEQADARREALERTTSIDLQQARRSVQVANDSVDVATQARDAAAQIDDMTQKTFRAGMSTSLELVVAASALRQAEITLALRQFDLVRAEIAAALTLASCPW